MSIISFVICSSGSRSVNMTWSSSEFWLSHVPADKLSPFLQAVRAALRPGGRLFLVDSLNGDSANATTGTRTIEGDRQQRQLKDGRQFEIVKIYYEPSELAETLRQHGLPSQVLATENFFLYADGQRQ